MFERICIAPKSPFDGSFDVGSIAEALIFYGEVIIIAQYSSLESLIRLFGPETLIRYLEHGRLKLKYRQHILGVVSQGAPTTSPTYDFGLIKSADHDIELAAQNLFAPLTSRAIAGKRLADRFLTLVEPISYRSDITRVLVDEICNYSYISEYVSRRLRKNIPSVPNRDLSFRFDCPLRGLGYPLATNINFSELNDLGLEDETISKPSSILAHYATTVADLSLWCDLESEVSVNENQADVLQARFDTLLRDRNNSQNSLCSFQEMCFRDGKAIRRAINSGSRSLEDLYPVIENSDRFRGWLNQLSPEESLIGAYYESVTKDSWVDKLPTKGLRWLIFEGTGAIIDNLGGPGIGSLASSLLDTFLLDRIVRGWKPNQFVNEELVKFINQ